MDKKLSGFRVAILVTDGFEQSELTGPRKALDDEGARTQIVSPAHARVQGCKHGEKADQFPVDVALDAANADAFDALLLPGGVANPDALRIIPKAVAFAKRFVQQGKPIAAICHGPALLIEAEAVEGRKLTSWPSLKTDLRNAGAQWVDEEVVSDRGLITSRKPDDIPAFNAMLIKEFAATQSKHRAGSA